PISGKYVVITKINAVQELLNEKELFALKSGDAESLLRQKFRIINAWGIEGSINTYFAFKPDSFITRRKKQIIKCDVYVALSDENGLFGEKEGIANPMIIS
ncbi:MAG: hypothetical protein IKU61_04690, partial [Clostridia bacterium]|nr:hypothetical protein [Clostridia bacterium]